MAEKRQITELYKITHARLANQIALNLNEEIKHTSYYKRELKRALNPAIKELIKHETEFDEFFDKLEESTVTVYDINEDYIKTVSLVPIWEQKNLVAMIHASRLDPKSMAGITNKILKNHNEKIDKLV